VAEATPMALGGGLATPRTKFFFLKILGFRSHPLAQPRWPATSYGVADPSTFILFDFTFLLFDFNILIFIFFLKIN
jgi:hypothetical protein